MYTGFSDIQTVCQSYIAWKNYRHVNFIHYEDMLDVEDKGTRVQNQKYRIDELLEYLEIEVSAPERRNIIKNAYDIKSPTFNTGKINKFKEVFTRKQIEYFNEYYGELLNTMGYKDY